uniref:Peptidoglycan-associated lipoprotein n=1 Tax=Candidatus Kentrum sp. TUN TaxID=2126343 RepID=A0A450ZRF0_9GAMM|nr:MAG: peptidoglycan-associated lipoprotein [Candidatus Kentron sp. TUN]
MNKRIIRLVAIGFSSLALVACGGGAFTKSSGGADVQEGSAYYDGYSGTIGSDEGMSMNSLNDPSSLLSTRVIYFDFDSNEIKPEFQEILKAHSDYLVDNSNVKVQLGGHCDQRGTREYNLALGERRAKAVFRFMSMLGVSGDQLDTVSYGEEKPADPDNGQFAWQKNRRVEIIYQSQ